VKYKNNLNIKKMSYESYKKIKILG